ncbi:MAG: hypothetical protein JO189_29365 [Deltaproteobacteria bacterium]|nr:hypothetical protein [Deltaproteobacteria bacterium]
MGFWRAVANIVFGSLSTRPASSADPSSANNPGIMTPTECEYDEQSRYTESKDDTAGTTIPEWHDESQSDRPSWNATEVTQAPFNFSGLTPLYHEAVRNNERTIAFETRDGVGRFVFMMFFSEDDMESHDKLFILLARTNVLIKLKLYGSHRRGDFKAYLTSKDEKDIRAELDIHGGTHAFNLIRFLTNLNAGFPDHLSLVQRIKTLSEHKDLFQTNQLRETVDDALKVYLVGPRGLPEGHRPREKTLRKLYLYVKGDPAVIAEFISDLKKANKTVAWTDDPRKANNNSISFLNSLTLYEGGGSDNGSWLPTKKPYC